MTGTGFPHGPQLVNPHRVDGSCRRVGFGKFACRLVLKCVSLHGGMNEWGSHLPPEQASPSHLSSKGLPVAGTRAGRALKVALVSLPFPPQFTEEARGPPAGR